MRTTINIDPHLLQEAKRRAVEERVSLSALISRSLRDALNAPRTEEEASFSMVTFGGAPTKERVRHEPADFWLLQEGDDARGFRR